LVITKVYDYNGKKVRFTRFSYYMSPVTIIPTAEKDPTSVIATAIKVDFTDLDTEAKATEGVKKTLQFQQIPFSSVNIGIGVSESLNAKKPKDFPSDNPLSDAGDYWDDWKSYIFTKLEGSMDKDGDGRFETGITIHTGGKEVYKTMSFKKTYEVKEGVTPVLAFEVELDKLLTGIDLSNITSTHQFGDLPTMQKFVNNFQTALILK
jgi:hypothetical protein